MTTAEAVILAVVEGLMEYLPVSSTAHLKLTEAALKMQQSPFNNLYVVAVQFGAILAVLFTYWKRFFQSFDFYLKLFVAFLPVAIIGLLLNDFVDSLLESMTTIAVSLIVGGIILIIVDKIFVKQLAAETEDEKDFSVSWLQAFIIGCFQCIAIIPGVSRSATAIVGGLQQGFNIRKAAEFSFFVGVPTISAAALYKLMKSYDYITAENINYLLIGNFISFIVGMFSIKFFIRLITQYGLKFFGYYRIVIGAVILILIALGHQLEIPE